jgi:3-methyladenine DNA glycosylase AlkD
VTGQSEVTARAVAFVAAQKPAAEQLGGELAELIGDPDAFAQTLGRGFARLADPEYLEGEHRIAPGLGRTYGVRWPLSAAVDRGFRAATRRERPTGYLELADRLFAEAELEMRWFAFGLLDRLLPSDPERAWQLLRRAAREAADWITVDALAHPYGRGIILEPFRWAELEQLTWSPSQWERRLIGSTVATLPFVDHRAGRTPDVAAHGLGLIGTLLGDAEPNVQKALAWALRSLVLVDPDGVLAFVKLEAARAAVTADGQRAWVLRDTLVKLPAADAARIKAELGSIRRRPGAPATSAAAGSLASFRAATAGEAPEEAAEPGRTRQPVLA